MALFLYHVVFGVRYLGILNGVAAFVIIGIGKGKGYITFFIAGRVWHFVNFTKSFIC